MITPAGKVAEQKEYFRLLLAGEVVDSFETSRVAKDGSILDVWLTVTKVIEEPTDSVIATDQQIVKPIGLALLERNITARKRAEAELREKEGLLANIYENVKDGLFYLDVEAVGIYRFRSVNPAYLKIIGLESSQVVGKYVNEVIPEPSLSIVLSNYRKAIQNLERLSWEDNSTYPSGIRTLDFAIIPIINDQGFCTGLIGDVHDITEHKRIENALKESEEKYRTIFENTGSATMIVEDDMTISMVNDECSRLSGYAEEELIGNKWTKFISEDGIEAMNEYQRRLRTDPAAVPYRFSTRMIDRLGKYRDGLVAVDIIPGTNNSVITFTDFTDFNRIDRSLKAISAVNVAMIQAQNEVDLLQNVCLKIVEEAGYSMVWVGYLQADLQQNVQPVACAGKNDGYLAKLNISLQDSKRGWGPVGTAIRTGQSVVLSDLKKDDFFKPWLKNALRQGFKSMMAIPLTGYNTTLGALNIYSNQIGRFDSDEQQLLIEMANDLGYAIMSMRTRTQHQLTAQELQKSLDKMKRILIQAVTSLGNTLEIRDPYTSGHQIKVTCLAMAIAEEMGCSKDQIEGIEVAGNLHDIGKIGVPSGILNRPGKLSEFELAIIQTHPQAGYEIVKDIEFSWPVAEVLLQHHERMNGSGYPQGLAGDEILMEARIMAVADVVEAMASHRPYRPALGIDIALEEIAQNKGILYDADVAEVCLKLFRDKSFRWE
jgi:PAS domain S-box-containing protein